MTTPRPWSTALAVLALASQASALDLPFEKTTLPNGLTLIVHEDHTLPLAAANLLYDVGARDEEPGRTGFAHLFEHLMFMGTRRAPSKKFDEWLEAAGGSNNAWTSSDFTDYHELGPSTLAPLFLWLEADRMDALGGEIDRAKLDLQRDVVRNERRQSIENVPYGKVELRLPELLWPEGHPYHHPVIGSHADLEAASVGDVRAFFARWYVASNATLVVAGDVVAADVRALAERSFGWMPKAPKPERAKVAEPAPLGRVVRETLVDRVELPKLVMAWRSPAHFAPGDAELDLFSQVLAQGKAGRLYHALVYDRAIAQSVSASQSSDALASTFTLEVVLRKGVAIDAAERAVDRVLAQALAAPPTEAELARARIGFEHGFVARLQSLAARARLLAAYQAERGDPGWAARDLERYRVATPADVLRAARATLTESDRVVLRVVPEPSRGAR